MLTLLDLLSLTDEQKQEGVWLSGVEGEGEFKKWYLNGQLNEYSNWKNGKEDGEVRGWHPNGQLYEHSKWKNGEREGECKRWWSNGYLREHKLYKNDKVIMDYLC